MTTITESPAATLPPVPPTMSEAPSGVPFSLPKIFLGLLLVVASFDLCFWNAGGLGFSLALFVPILAAAILFNREKSGVRHSTILIGALLAGACAETVIETGTSNALVLLMLIVALAGDSYFNGTEASWSRWVSQVIALVFAPARAFWLTIRVVEAGFTGRGGKGMALVRAALLALPALVLALIFGSLLASGNAVFGAWTGNFFDWLGKEIAKLFDLGRFTMWVFVAFCALPLLSPGRVSAWWWRWMAELPRWPEWVPVSGAAFSSFLILAVMNVMFGVANVADLMFLWSGTKLPAGVTYSSYVHSGVNTLTFTVLLSALVLAGIFQQQLSVAGRRGLKALGLAWIAQNLFVLVSVVLRLKLYIEAYDMTVARLSVILFLLLVAAGYGLLAIKIVREKSLPWLVGRCALAVFATLYVAQFLNLAGWSADYNVARWEKDRTRNLDVEYLFGLGPAGWPAARRAADEGANWSQQFRDEGENLSPLESLRSHDSQWPVDEFSSAHWREFSLRAYWNRWALEDKK